MSSCTACPADKYSEAGIGQVCESRLIAHWPLDEGSGSSILDISGSEFGGTAYGASWTTGIIGSALSLDGNNDYIQFVNDLGLGTSFSWTF